MARVILATTRVDDLLKLFSQSRAERLADFVLELTGTESIDRGRTERMLDGIGVGCDAYEVRCSRWPRSRSGRLPGNEIRLYFFAASEQEVLDRLTVAEVLLL